jgi:hypothetical protein
VNVQQPTCLWCGRSFKPRTTGGSAQRFCSAAHRHAFGSAARRWAVRVVEAGLVSVETFKAAGSSVRAVGTPFGPTPSPGVG